MEPKNIKKVFLIFLSLFLVCTSSALAEDQVQHQTGIIDKLKQDWNTLRSCGEVLLSKASYEINHQTNGNENENNITTQEDLDFWNDSQSRYPFSEKPVLISMDSVCGPAYNYIPEGVTGAKVTDNSGNVLDSYTVTKNEKGFTIQKGAPVNPDHSYAITLNKLEELDETYGNVRQVRAGEMYIKEQIQNQA